MNKKDTVYHVKIMPNGQFSVYTKIKKLFGEKFQKVSPIEFFNVSRRDLVQKGKYSIVPNMSGMGALTYLDSKAMFNLLNGLSDFNQRTVWKLNNFNEEHKIIGKTELEDDIYEGIVSCSLNISGQDGRPLVEIEDFELPYIDAHIPSKKELELLLQNACNGKFITARDKISYLNEVHKNAGLEDVKFMCDECGEIFDSLPEFFSHLVETGHKDSVLIMHKNDPEIKKLLSLMEKNHPSEVNKEQEAN